MANELKTFRITTEAGEILMIEADSVKTAREDAYEDYLCVDEEIATVERVARDYPDGPL